MQLLDSEHEDSNQQPQFFSLHKLSKRDGIFLLVYCVCCISFGGLVLAQKSLPWGKHYEKFACINFGNPRAWLAIVGTFWCLWEITEVHKEVMSQASKQKPPTASEQPQHPTQPSARLKATLGSWQAKFVRRMIATLILGIAAAVDPLCFLQSHFGLRAALFHTTRIGETAAQSSVTFDARGTALCGMLTLAGLVFFGPLHQATQQRARLLSQQNADAVLKVKLRNIVVMWSVVCFLLFFVVCFLLGVSANDQTDSWDFGTGFLSLLFTLCGEITHRLYPKNIFFGNMFSTTIGLWILCLSIAIYDVHKFSALMRYFPAYSQTNTNNTGPSTAWPFDGKSTHYQICVGLQFPRTTLALVGGLLCVVSFAAVEQRAETQKLTFAHLCLEMFSIGIFTLSMGFHRGATHFTFDPRANLAFILGILSGLCAVSVRAIGAMPTASWARQYGLFNVTQTVLVVLWWLWAVMASVDSKMQVVDYRSLIFGFCGCVGVVAGVSVLDSVRRAGSWWREHRLDNPVLDPNSLGPIWYATGWVFLCCAATMNKY